MRKILAGLTLALASLTAQAALLEVSPLSQIVNVGDDVVVNVSGSGFNGILGGGFDLSYNPAVLSLGSPASVSLAAPPWDGGFPRTDSIDDTTGKVSGFSFNQFSGVSGSAQIATLTFKAKAAGFSDLTLSASASFPFADINGAVPVDVAGAQVTVNAVPEPTTWALLAGGLGLMVLLVGRRGQRGSQT